MLIILIFILALIPSLIWLWIYQIQDREAPEPRSLIRKLFLAGALITLPAIFLEGLILGIIPGTNYSFWKTIPSLDPIFNILIAILVTALVEEYLKYIVTKKITWPLRAFDQIIDGVIYGVSIALGFALVENFLYLLPFAFSSASAYAGWNLFSLVFASRFLLTTLMHSLSSGLMGLYLGKAHFTPQKASFFIKKGLFLAISFHGLFNLLAMINQVFFVFIITSALAIYFIPRLKNKENLKVRYSSKSRFA
jgi:RsiW-degrading membrane proteinase PrsW (M82 family)